MKKFFLFLFLLLFINFVFAVEILMNPEYKQGETIIARISGDFLSSIGKNNLFFYKEHVRIPFEYNLARFGYDYYIYALSTGKTSGNYSLSIEDVRHRTAGVVSDEDITKNFSILNETADFSVEPGFVDASGNFDLTIKNLKDSSVNVKIVSHSSRVFVYSAGTTEFTTTLNSGRTEKINFKVIGGTETFGNISLSSENTDYSIPIHLFETNNSETISPTEEIGLGFQTSRLIIVIPTNSNYRQIIYLYNLNNSDLKVDFSLSENLANYAVLSKENLNIPTNSNASLELSLFSQNEGEIEGFVYAAVDGESLPLPVSARFVENVSTITPEENPNVTKTCAEQNAVTYNTETHTCTSIGNPEITLKPEPGKDGWCCSGTVSEIRDSNSTGRIIAVVLIIGVIGFIVWFYFNKYKKSKKPVDVLKVAQGKPKLKN